MISGTATACIQAPQTLCHAINRGHGRQRILRSPRDDREHLNPIARSNLHKPPIHHLLI